MAKAKGRRPDYNVNAWNHNTDEKGRIGAAWANDDGTIGVKLNPFVRLDLSDDIQIMLFPRDSPEEFTDDNEEASRDDF